MANEHKSGLPDSYDRAEGKPEQQAVVFYGKRPFIETTELNELQTIIRGRHDRLGRLIAKDGDRVEFASAVVDVLAETVTLTEGKIYVAGDVFPVEAAVLTAVPMTGSLTIGVKLVREWITHEDDPDLLGIVPGTDSEGEPGAAREVVTIEWARSDTVIGEYYSVYTLQDGTILDQTPPPMLDGVRQGLAAYDRPHGHYIVSGCRVTAIGADAGDQIFSIESGEANINGFKSTRFASLRHAETEDWDEGAVPGETQTYTGGASQTFTLAAYPLAVINQILLTKEKTVSVTRGVVGGGADGLPDTSVIELIEVKQGGTTYTPTTDYIRTGNTVDWAPGGIEPAGGSSYTVKYRYRDAVTADSFTDTTVTVSGGATGGDVIFSYTYKMPRIDILCLDQNGAPVYVKGRSAARDLLPPVVPLDILPLCQILNTWMATPTVLNDGVRSMTYAAWWRVSNQVQDQARLLQLLYRQSTIDSKDPVAKKGQFVDPFNDDTYRDAGLSQTASIGDEVMQLAIVPTFYMATLSAPVTLNYVEEIIASQLLKTGCTKINPYANFNPLPGRLLLTPAADFWEEQQTVWASPATVTFNLGTETVRRSSSLFFGTQTTSETISTSSTEDQVVNYREQTARFLRQRSVSFTISGFGAGEILQSMTLDGVNIKPAGVITANGSGVITNTFNIPANIPVGSKPVVAIGAGGTRAEAIYTGQGLIEITTMRRLTTVQNRTIQTITQGVRNLSAGTGSGDRADPQAQLFAVNEPRQILGFDFHLCAIGNTSDHLVVDMVNVDNGYPTSDVIADAFVPMTGAVVGWKSGRFNLPAYTPSDRFHSFVIKTDDNVHSVSLAKLGGFDAALQQWVSAHPYAVGPRFSSVNAETWTAHQDEALTFRMIAAKYTGLTKTVNLGTFAVVNQSDLQVRAAVEIPSPDCDVVFEIERANGDIYRVRSHQVVRLPEFITENVILRAILTGTEKLSPILYAPVLFITGEMQTTGTYVTRAFNFGTAITLTAYMKKHLPSGATVDVKYDKDDNTWIDLPLTATEALADPRWVEGKHSATPITAVRGRLKITLTGTPAARPEIADLGLNVY